ncbi:MAG: ribulose-phosphate 3-epimerase, partial [Rikenellaceae bacterium]|nr:ribulose-phosphate 3-epimerase [Rikenellaceae bacterium]
ISFGMPVLESVRKHTKLFLDVHMMVAQPERYIEEMIQLGADGITIHVEACDCIPETLAKIRELGVKTGIAINPETPVSAVFPYMEMVDMVLVMSVNPGFASQKFIPSSVDKVRRLRNMAAGREVLIEVDGGVSADNAGVLFDAGADVLVAGSAVFKAQDPKAAIARLLECR